MLNRRKSTQTNNILVYMFLTVVTFVVYWQINKFDFIDLDDFVYVSENYHIRSGITLEGIRWAFTTTYADFWHPLTWLSLMFDYQLYGLHAGGYHVTNLILHVLSTLLLLWLFHRMTHEIWKSAFVAAFFALHPLHVESVAWISERKDVLSAFFWMLTLCCYVYYTEKPMIKRYLLVLFSFILALMSKPMVITLPLVMILLDYWPLKRFQSQKSNWFLWQAKEKWLLLIFSGFFAFITIYVQHDPSGSYFPFTSRLANAPVAFIMYLINTFWPFNLAVFYPFPAPIPIWLVTGAMMLIVTITAFVIHKVKRLPYLFVGWLWYTIILLPVIGIVQVGNHNMADRYTYLPLIGISVGLAWGVPSLFAGRYLQKNIVLSLTIVFLVLLTFLSWQQCGYWKNSIRLFNHALRVTKENYIAHGSLGIALSKEGKIKESIDHYNKAISIRPDYFKPYDSRGFVYDTLGRYQQAIEDFSAAIHLNPDHVVSYNNRGASYDKSGQYQKALEDYNTAIRMKPDYAEAFNNRGIVLFKLGQYQKAFEDFSQAIHFNPRFSDAYNNRAVVYLNQNNMVSGCLDARKACELGMCTTLQAAAARGLCR